MKQSMSFSFPAGAAIGHTIYPGAMLDPDHATNDLVWLATGEISDIEIHSPLSATDITTWVLDCKDSNGRPVQSATFGELYAVEDAAPGAAAQKAGLGDPGLGIAAGTPIYNIGSSNALPSEVHLGQSIRRTYSVRERTAAAQTSKIQSLSPEPTWCGYGMAIRLAGPSLVAGSTAIIVVHFTPVVPGSVRYARARLDQANKIVV